jgi:hypothetical protein
MRNKVATGMNNRQHQYISIPLCADDHVRTDAMRQEGLNVGDGQKNTRFSLDQPEESIECIKVL